MGAKPVPTRSRRRKSITATDPAKAAGRHHGNALHQRPPERYYGNALQKHLPTRHSANARRKHLPTRHPGNAPPRQKGITATHPANARRKHLPTRHPGNAPQKGTPTDLTQNPQTPIEPKLLRPIPKSPAPDHILVTFYPQTSPSFECVHYSMI